jgi:hypothetical protein
MFENFTFGAQSRTRYDCEGSASPTDTTYLSVQPLPPISYPSYPFPDLGLDGIAYKLEQQCLSGESRARDFESWSEPSSSPIEMDDQAEMSYTPRTSTSSAPPYSSDFPSPTPVVCRRMQRQLNVQMQCSSNHIRDINTLVEKMIASSSQCQVYEPLSRYNVSSSRLAQRVGAISVDTDYAVLNNGLLTPNLEVDEGFDEEFNEETFDEISLRRASTPSGIRKYSGISFTRSADIVWENGRAKVQCKHRMRKRKISKRKG